MQPTADDQANSKAVEATRFWPSLAPKRLLMSEKLFIFTFAVWAVVNLPPWFGSLSMLDILLGWMSTVRPANSIFPITYSLAIVSFLFAFIRIKAGLPYRLLLSASFPFAFVQTFETIYQRLGYAINPLAFAGTVQPQVMAVEASWLLLGFSTIPLWRLSRKGIACLLFLASGFALWVLVDYPRVPRLQPIGIGLLLNIALKIVSAVLFVILLFDGTRRQSLSSLSTSE